MKVSVQTDKAPAAIGPYSQGNKAGGLVFVSGQLPIDPAAGTMAQGIEAQTRQSIENLKNVLESAGASLGTVLKTTVFLSDMNNFAAMNKVYEEMFAGTVFPARSAVEVARLPKDALVEVEAIACQLEDKE